MNDKTREEFGHLPGMWDKSDLIGGETDCNTLVDIAAELSRQVAQENCDGEPFDTMQAASKYIRRLEQRIAELNQQLFDSKLTNTITLSDEATHKVNVKLTRQNRELRIWLDIDKIYAVPKISHDAVTKGKRYQVRNLLGTPLVDIIGFSILDNCGEISSFFIKDNPRFSSTKIDEFTFEYVNGDKALGGE